MNKQFDTAAVARVSTAVLNKRVYWVEKQTVSREKKKHEAQVEVAEEYAAVAEALRWDRLDDSTWEELRQSRARLG